MAAARGIDLQHVAGISTNIDGIAGPRALTDEERKIGITRVRETVRGRETRGHRRPAWTAAELGQAANGLGPIPWSAALYSFAGARDGYWLLWHALANEAHRLARRECWPPRVMTERGEQRFYREDLAELVLIEDANKYLFAAAPQLYAIKMGVSAEVWDKQLDQPFRTIKGTYDRWLGIAQSAIGKWIRREE